VLKDTRLFSEPHGVKTVVARPWTLAECSKRVMYTFACPSYSSNTTSFTARDTATVSKMGHMITVGLSMLRV
jgi:hypothetical protein